MSAQDSLGPQFSAFHAGTDPAEMSSDRWFHAGTLNAAGQRGEMFPERGMYGVGVHPRSPANSPDKPASDYDANRISNWLETGAERDEKGMPTTPLAWVSHSRDNSDLHEAIKNTGFDDKKHDALYYKNDVEDSGSVSALVHPRAVGGRSVIHHGQGSFFPEEPFLRKEQ